MLIVWFVLLSALLSLYLALPWFSRPKPLYQDTTDMDELLLERERTYNALADLDFDYEAGKLSEADYQMLRQQLLTEAAQVLRIIDAADQGKSAEPQAQRAEDSVEDVIAQYKRRRQKQES